MATTDRKMALVAFYFFVLSLGVSAVEQASTKETDPEDPWVDGRILGDPSPALDDAQTLSELLKESPWALVAFKEFPEVRRRQSATFTPRLGQASAEIVDEEFDDNWSGRTPERRGTPPFAPRLGRRNGVPLQPRMGRRHSRGNSGGEEATASHTSSERHYLFSPRLGRGSPTPAEGMAKEG
ncbi:hypothetical protein J437_LFUL002273 [Ladona fulva]|uniref:Uncharacterized protein n=1 Tax=Ladona fulva TaxID=123851 RepID=A0A8K0NWS2_LADFU|nr:hypothetical protein J437_LFUL002273 [Ladona fulva]